MASTKIFVSVCDRLSATIACVNSIVESTRGKADIWLFDNDSQLDWPALQREYVYWVNEGYVQGLFINSGGLIESANAGWSKNFAWAQFMKMLELLPPEERKYVVMVDNDTKAGMGWLPLSLRFLATDLAKENNVKVVSPYDGDDGTKPVNEKVVEDGGRKFAIRSKLCSRFWVAEYEWWASYELPPWELRTVTAGDKEFKDRVPTDWWYFHQMQEKGEKFAVMDPPICTDPGFRFGSARRSRGVGADWNPEYRKLAGMGPLK